MIDRINKVKFLDQHDAVALYFNISLIASFVDSLFKIFGVGSDLRSSIVTILTMFTFLVVIFQGKVVIRIYFLLTVGIWAILILSALIFFKPPSYILREATIDGISHILIPVFLFSQVKSIYLLINSFKKYIPIAVLYCLLQFFYRSTETGAHYTFTYSVLVSALLLFALLVEEGGKKYIIEFIIVITSLVLFGGRAALLCFAVEFLFYILLYNNAGKRVYAYIAIVLLLFLLFAFWNLIAETLINLLPNARSVMFLSGQAEDNTRSIIWTELMRQVVEHPLMIRGILSDRVAVSKYFGIFATNRILGSYAHNFIVEILYEFGLMGLVFLIVFLNFVRKVFVKSRKSEKSIKIFFLIFTAFFFAKLSVSSSYLIDLATGGLLGMLFVLSDYFKENLEVNHR